MANRAYLLSTPTVETYERGLVDDDDPYHLAYFDSRWNVPIAWWFLFAPTDVLSADLAGGCQEVRLRSSKAAALERFLTRRPRLELVLDNRLDLRHLDCFVRVIRGWPGECLLIDASEIWASGVEEPEPLHISSMLEAIDADPFEPDLVVDLAAEWSSPRKKLDDESRLASHLVGNSYGEVSRRIYETAFRSG